ncbi:unnamed protein product [Vicia faba]|uniref:Rubisco LSMT substrate-binding domain-containing protein n=1 Tax=Vicia faba TaxID=3906 RepID=A0AAV0Z9R5_VICFA|nr:unnamed protein product [Vicia faba]
MELSRLSLSDNHFFLSSPIHRSPRTRPLPALPAFFTTRRRRRGLCSASNSDTLVAAAAKKHGDDDTDLKTWMHKNGLPPCKVVLKDKPSLDDSLKPIHYVAASEDLQKGDVAFSIPSSLVVTLERVLGNETIAELLTTNKFSELACLALYLMGQLAVESPLLWSESELAYLEGSPLKDEIVKRIEEIRKEYNELDLVWFMSGSLFQQYPYDIPTEAFPFEIFKQAFAAVQSCVVHLQNVSLARRFAPAGDPIVVWCGPQPNTKLLTNYGFVDDDNPMIAALSTEDPQYQEKRMVAQRNGKLSIQTFNVYTGKEREAVLDMIPYLRLGYVSDPSEMQSVISSEGPVCPMSPCMERAVLDQLADYFNSRLAAYPTTLAEDESMLADVSLNPKRRVATQLVRLERKRFMHVCRQSRIS